MRLAPRSRPVVFGLPILLFQLWMNLPAAAAWETARADGGSDSNAQAAGSLRFVTPVSRPESRWATDQVPQRQSGSRPIVDSAVQQAAWNAPRRIPKSIDASHPAAAMLRDESQGGRNGAMLGGHEFRFPGGLFSRNKDSGGATPGKMQPLPGSQSTLRLPSQATQRPITTRSNANQLSQPNLGKSMSGNGIQRQARQPSTELRVAERVSPQSAKAPQTVHRSPTNFTAAEPIPSPMTALQQTAAKAPAEAVPVATPGSPAETLLAEAHKLSGSAQSAEDYSRIIESCRRALVSQPSAAVREYANDLAGWALNRRGQLKAEAGQIQEAILDFEDALRADADCWRAVHNRGVLLAQAGQFEKAFDDFNRTIQIKQDFAKAYSNRGALFVVANDLNAALADYGRAIQLDTNLAVAHRGRGRVCHLLGKLDEAIAHYDAAVQLSPDDSYAVACRADLLTDLGRYVDANAEYNHAIELDPKSVHAFSGSAWLLSTCPDKAIRNPALAIERANKSIELSGKWDAMSFDTLAAAQANAGDFATAVKTMRRAIEMAEADERDVYQDRLAMYSHAKPYRIAPVRPVTQASYSEVQRAGSGE
jgi:tetratricopeptide (TPR) repeat protein